MAAWQMMVQNQGIAPNDHQPLCLSIGSISLGSTGIPSTSTWPDRWYLRNTRGRWAGGGNQRIPMNHEPQESDQPRESGKPLTCMCWLAGLTPVRK